MQEYIDKLKKLGKSTLEAHRIYSFFKNELSIELLNYLIDKMERTNFARDNPRGVFVLGTGTHTATVIDGILYDNWNSSDETVQFVWYLD